jgi:hypothetical protein
MRIWITKLHFLRNCRYRCYSTYGYNDTSERARAFLLHGEIEIYKGRESLATMQVQIYCTIFVPAWLACSKLNSNPKRHQLVHRVSLPKAKWLKECSTYV